jgi:polysaccharide biosynthesis PFTS motif protein
MPEHAVAPTDLRYYRQAHLEIARRHSAFICPDGLPAHQLVTQTDAAIVLPFTTPATIYRLFGKPAAYFDPTGQLARHDLMARGAPILVDRQALRQWISSVLDGADQRRRVGT